MFVRRLVLLVPLAACAAVPPPSSTARSLAVAERPEAIDGALWDRYQAASEFCDAVADALQRKADEARRRSVRNGRLSTVAGALAMAAGLTAGILASQADDDGQAARTGAVGGNVAFAFGVVATGGGVAASRRGADAGENAALAEAVRGAIYESSLRVFRPTSRPAREAALAAELRALPATCRGIAEGALSAGRLDELASDARL
ncbi:MAG: hypothetical protein AAGH15_10810 [Myxococcota bacterium]